MTLFEPPERSTAVLSDDRHHRFVLYRTWAPDAVRRMVFIGLNPSTADETADDPTIRRCVGFAKREGCDGLVMLNLWPLRATNPTELRHWGNRDVMAVNTRHVGDELHLAKLTNAPVVAAWGAYKVNPLVGPTAVQTIAAVEGVDLWCLGRTKDGFPRHPLYVKADQPLEPWG